MPNLALLALEASDGTVVLTSITLVFAMLVALCLIITLEGKICLLYTSPSPRD